MELISRMMDGSIPYDPQDACNPSGRSGMTPRPRGPL